MSRRPTVGFVTCVQIGLSCMEEIYEAGGTLDFVMTLPDDVARRKSGRVFMDAFCDRNHIPLVKVRNINDAQSIAELNSRRPDWLFIIGWSQIAGPAVLAAMTKGVLGMHPTLLPQGRGRAAIPWAILKGLTETGVTLFKLDDGVDTGPIVGQERVPIAPSETATTLYGKIATAHRLLMRAVWADLMADRIRLTPQNERLATIWPGRTPKDGLILPTMTSVQIDRLVRATTRPYPGAFVEQDGRIVRVWSGNVAKPGSAVPAGVLRIESCDGAFDAVDYEVEGDQVSHSKSPPEVNKQ